MSMRHNDLQPYDNRNVRDDASPEVGNAMCVVISMHNWSEPLLGRGLGLPPPATESRLRLPVTASPSSSFRHRSFLQRPTMSHS